jgi:cell division protease FtsH
MTRQTKFHIGYWIIALLAIFVLQSEIATMLQVQRIPYSDFERYLDQGKVAEVAISDKYIQGRLKEPLPSGKTEFVTTRVDPNFADQLAKHNIKYSGEVENTFLSSLLSWVVPAVVFVGIWMFAMRRLAGGIGGGLMQIGKSKAKVLVEADTGVKFEDVAGVDEAKDELKEVVAFLKDPRKYGRLGARMPKGVLLAGSEFVEMFVGVGAARVRDLFEQARAKAPAIIFIDELDALGRARGIGPYGGHDEKEQTLNQLLVEMDGFDSSTGLVLLAATNRPEILDPALLRAGRFDRQVLVDRPDKKGRIDILRVHLKKAKLAPDVDVEKVAALTPGFTGADLANLVNEATLLATRRGADQVTMEDFNNAVERIVAGLEKRNRLLNPREREIVAYHELGHALVATSLPGTDPVHKVSIIPRGVGALGYTVQRPTEDRFLMTREELENKMAVLLGGRASELIIFKHLSTGAADDLAKATDIARAMVTRYGMSEEVGNVALEKDQRSFLSPNPFLAGPRERDYSDETASVVDAQVRRIVDQALERAVAILTRNRAALDRAAKRLLEKETLDENEVKELLGPVEKKAVA